MNNTADNITRRMDAIQAVAIRADREAAEFFAADAAATVVEDDGGDWLQSLLGAVAEGPLAVTDYTLGCDAKTQAADARAKLAPLRIELRAHVGCGRCGGAGVLECYRHINNGECFGCNGTGVQFGYGSYMAA